MCLNIKHGCRPNRVVNRWKFLFRKPDGSLESPSIGYKWNLTTPNVATKKLYTPEYPSQSSGFHVYLTRRDAERAIPHWVPIDPHLPRVVVKLKVDDFKATGIISQCDKYSNGRVGEIWGMATIVALYDPKTGKEIKQ
jgi:hypothetical protein